MKLEEWKKKRKRKRKEEFVQSVQVFSHRTLGEIVSVSLA